MATALNDRDREVLEAFDGKRANPYLLRERTEMGKGDVNTALNRLARSGYIEQVTHGLYARTEKGEEALDD